MKRKRDFIGNHLMAKRRKMEENIKNIDRNILDYVNEFYVKEVYNGNLPIIIFNEEIELFEEEKDKLECHNIDLEIIYEVPYNFTREVLEGEEKQIYVVQTKIENQEFNVFFPPDTTNVKVDAVLDSLDHNSSYEKVFAFGFDWIENSIEENSKYAMEIKKIDKKSLLFEGVIILKNLYAVIPKKNM